MIINTISVNEIMTRCLKAASQCVAQGDNQAAREQLKNTFNQIAQDAAPWKLQGEEIVRGYFRPIQEQLADRYPKEIARQIYWDFFDVFWTLWRTGGRSSRKRPGGEIRLRTWDISTL